MYVVHAFAWLRELTPNLQGLANRLDALEEKTVALAMKHDTFSRNTHAQLKQVFDALRALMARARPAQALDRVRRSGREEQDEATSESREARRLLTRKLESDPNSWTPIPWRLVNGCAK